MTGKKEERPSPSSNKCNKDQFVETETNRATEGISKKENLVTFPTKGKVERPDLKMVLQALFFFPSSRLIKLIYSKKRPWSIHTIFDGTVEKHPY